MNPVIETPFEYIGQAEPRDEPELSTLFCALSGDLYPTMSEMRASVLNWYTGKNLLRAIQDPYHVILACGDHSGLVGFLIGWHTDEKTLRLVAGAVRPDRRGVKLDFGGTFSDALLMNIKRHVLPVETGVEIMVHESEDHALTTLTRNGFAHDKKFRLEPLVSDGYMRLTSVPRLVS